MRPPLTPQEVRDLLERAARGTDLLVWDGDRYHLVTPEALLAAFAKENEA